MTSYYTRNKLKMINANVENHCKAAQFNNVETTNVRRDVRLFGVDLFTVDGELLNKLFFNLDSKRLQISSDNKYKGKYMVNFIKKFNRGIICNDLNYSLSENSEFYLSPYRNKFIIVLDKNNNNLSVNKRCFNMDGELLTKVKDTLTSNGELNREGEKYKAIYKDTVIIHLERKVFSNSSKSIPITLTTVTNTNQPQDPKASSTTLRVTYQTDVPKLTSTSKPQDSKVISSKNSIHIPFLYKM